MSPSIITALSFNINHYYNGLTYLQEKIPYMQSNYNEQIWFYYLLFNNMHLQKSQKFEHQVILTVLWVDWGSPEQLSLPCNCSDIETGNGTPCLLYSFLVPSKNMLKLRFQPCSTQLVCASNSTMADFQKKCSKKTSPQYASANYTSARTVPTDVLAKASVSNKEGCIRMCIVQRPSL